MDTANPNPPIPTQPPIVPTPIAPVAAPPQPPPQSTTSAGVSPDGPPPEGIPAKKLLIVLGIIILILFITAVAAFAVASKRANLFEPITPTPEATPIDLVTPTPEATVAPTPAGTASGSSAPTPTPNPDVITKTITSVPALDGYFASNGTGSTTVDIRVGRNTYAITRGYVSFDLSGIPQTANIESATLRAYQTNTDGSPYTVLGNLLLDHVEYGDSLEGEDYALPPLTSGIATLTTNTNREWKEAVVTESLRADLLNHRRKSAFRLRFATEKIGGEAGGDYAYFESAENFAGTGNIPQLVVRYK